MTPEIRDEFQNLMSKKMNLFEKILECAKKQATLNCAEKPAEYKILLDKREQYIKDISRMEIRIRHFMEAKCNIPGNDDLEMELETANKKVTDIIRQILAIDETNKQKVMREMQDVKNKLEFIGKSRKGISGYASLGKLTPFGAYMDRRK